VCVEYIRRIVGGGRREEEERQRDREKEI